jgi:hypothetical protein
MNHIDINYRLASAMGWGVDSRGVSNMLWNGNCVQCRPEGNVWRKFDYRDPVIFAALVKRWRIYVAPAGHSFWVAEIEQTGWASDDTPELAAAMVVIASYEASVSKDTFAKERT